MNLYTLWVKITGFVIIISLYSSSSVAYTFLNCPGQNASWANPTQNFIVNRNHFDNFAGVDVNDVISEMQSAASRIESIRGSTFNPIVTGANNGNAMIDYGNGDNDVLLDIGETYGTNGAQIIVAITGICNAGANVNGDGTFIEVDIVFNDDIAWQPSPLNRFTYIGSLFAHEMGHAAGIGHSDSEWVLAQMNRVVGRVLGGPSQNEPGTPSFHGDDASALRQIYPNSGTGRNVYVSRYRRGLDADENIFTASINNRLLAANNVPVDANVTSGLQYKMEYTVGNNGTQSENVVVRMHYSTDGNIVPSDPLLPGSPSITLASGQAATGTHVFTMPALTSGQNYWFGYSVTVPGDIDAGDNRALLSRLVGNNWYTAN